MSDIPSTWPDFQNLVELQPKVQEVRRIESFPKLSFPVWTLVIETWGRVDYVLTAWGLRDERKGLKEEVNFEVKQKEILRKIYQNLWENNPELKKAIENQTIKIFEVPNRDLVALSIDGKNVDYLYDLEGRLVVDMLSNLNEEFLPYYILNMREVWYELSFENWVVIFTHLKKEKINNDFTYTIVWKPIKKSDSEYYDILIEWEKFREKVINTLEWILKERGVSVN